MQYLFGKPAVERILDETSRRSRALHARGITPTVAVVLVGNDPSSELYVNAKKRVAAKIGVDFILYHLPLHVAQDALSHLLITLSDDASVHGIVMQLPLPEQLDLTKLIKFVDPAKDIDHFGAESPFLAPTPAAVKELLDEYKVDCHGRSIGIIGKGFLVGQPLEKLLTDHGAIVEVFDATTQNIADKAKTKEILITASGQPRLVTKAFANPDQYIIDVGSARDAMNNQVVGDVDHDELDNYVAGITPLIGGVGPITVALLMRNVVTAAEKAQAI